MRLSRFRNAETGRPYGIVIDGSQTNREAIISCDAESRLRDRSRRALKAIHIRKSQYPNRIEQDHRRIKSRVGPMLGFKRFYNARRVVTGIELVQKIIKGQFEVPESFGTDPFSVWRNVVAA